MEWESNDMLCDTLQDVDTVLLTCTIGILLLDGLNLSFLQARPWFPNAPLLSKRAKKRK